MEIYLVLTVLWPFLPCATKGLSNTGEARQNTSKGLGYAAYTQRKWLWIRAQLVREPYYKQKVLCKDWNWAVNAGKDALLCTLPRMPYDEAMVKLLAGAWKDIRNIGYLPCMQLTQVIYPPSCMVSQIPTVVIHECKARSNPRTSLDTAAPLKER